MARTASLAFASWPEADVHLWARLTGIGGPLEDSGALSHLRATTLTCLQAGYERWLYWVMTHCSGAADELPEARATPVRLVAWLTSLGHLAPYTQLKFLSNTVTILAAAAPTLDWSVQRHLVRRAHRAALRSQSKRKVGRVLPSAELLAAGQRLALDLAQDEHTALSAALSVRDGAMVALLALLPMRRRSFSELRLGHSVLVCPENILISLSSEMTKNGLPWESPVPKAAAIILRRYIDETRPWLLARGHQRHSALWVGRTGEPLKDGAIALRISTGTTKTTGISVSPHLFRDAAATTLSRLSPENAQLIRPLLAHSGFGTAERHYIQAQGIETGRDYAAVLADLMKDK